MGKTDLAWRQWGKQDPYFGVLRDTRFRKARIQKHIHEFFESGRDFIDNRLEVAVRHFGFSNYGRALDFGCGVGRLSLPLSRTFKHVIGLDVSGDMLCEARRVAAQRGIVNAEFLESDDKLSRAPGLFDFVNSYIVLQHIPVERGLKLISELLDRVAPGGIASLHISISRGDTIARRLGYIAQRDISVARACVNAFYGRPLREPMMEMNEYPLVRVLNLAAVKGFGPCLTELEMHGRVATVKLMHCRTN